MNSLTLMIKPLRSESENIYNDHGVKHKGDSGIDLYCLNSISVMPGEEVRINFGISCEMLHTHNIKQSDKGLTRKSTEVKDNRSYLLIPRSSISKTPLIMSNSIGLIDAGYRGEIMASVRNVGKSQFIIEKGMRLFQIVAFDGSNIKIEIVNLLSETERGAGGFGSTGK